MSPEERQLLEATFKLAKENNKSLKKMNRRMVLGSVLRLVYWLIILGAGVGLFYFLQPQIDSIANTYGGFADKVESINSLLGNTIE